MIDALRKLFGVERTPGDVPQPIPRASPPSLSSRPISVDHIMTTEVVDRALVVTFIEPQVHADHAYIATEELRSLLLREPSVRHLVFDLSNVKHFDSTGLGMMVDLLSALKPRGGRIAIAAATQQVQVLFKLTRLELVFSIRRTVLEAIDALNDAATRAA